MVKGVSRRVIVVKSPDPRIFEEAIFLVREDAAHRGVTQDEILKEAQQVADNYIKNNAREKKSIKITPLPAAFAGAGVTVILWMLSQYF